MVINHLLNGMILPATPKVTAMSLKASETRRAERPSRRDSRAKPSFVVVRGRVSRIRRGKFSEPNRKPRKMKVNIYHTWILWDIEVR